MEKKLTKYVDRDFFFSKIVQEFFDIFLWYLIRKIGIFFQFFKFSVITNSGKFFYYEDIKNIRLDFKNIRYIL